MNKGILLISLFIIACTSIPLLGLRRTLDFPPTPYSVSSSTISRDDKKDAECFRTIYEAYQIATHIPDYLNNIPQLIENLRRLATLIQPSFDCLNFTGVEMIRTVNRFSNMTISNAMIDNKCIIEHLTNAYKKVGEISEDIENRDVQKLQEDINELIAIIEDMRNCF